MRCFPTLTLLAALLLVAFAQIATADVPQMINYQGRLSDSEGAPLDTTVSMTFTIYDDSTGGISWWTETQGSVTATDGLFHVILGAINPITDYAFSGSARWLEVVLESDTITPRTQLVSVAYSHRVSTVDGATGGIISGNVTIQSNLDVDGRVWATGTGRFGSGHTVSGADWFVAGEGNKVYSDGAFAAGINNVANGSFCVVSGGTLNTAKATGADWATTVGGGYDNQALGGFSTVAGGKNDSADGFGCTIGGGTDNIAAYAYSTVPGGRGCHALGRYSVAMGNRARADHNGSIVIAASAWDDIYNIVHSGGNEQIVLRADGGIYLTDTAETAPYDNTNIITTRGGAYLSGNGTTWSNSSDRDIKENFAPVNGAAVLEKISNLPISEWNYKEDDESIRHIGPVAQDFYETFGLGNDDKTISTVDPDGIALAAIKALYEKSKRIDELESELRELKALVEKLMEKND